MAQADSGRATISLIATEAGVSVPTVSKVLNGRPDVSQRTREHVEQVLAKHKYQRRSRGPGRAGPPLIELSFHELGPVWSIEIIRGVEAAAAELGVGTVLSEHGGSHRPEQSWLDAVVARRPLGVLLVLSSLSDEQRHQLESRSIPFVVIDTDGEPPKGVPTVGSNNWYGGRAATQHLLELGHRRIGMISGPTDVLCSRVRVDGFRSAHSEAGIADDPKLLRWGTFEAKAGFQYGHELLSQPDRPTAIFAGSDLQALGVIRAARQLGLRIPEDVSVVGFDNVPLAEWIGLTTVDQPLRAMARTATQILLALARGEEPELRRIDLATELVVRETTGPPPAH